MMFRCKDHPEANGRKPQLGEQAFTLTFPLEDGTSLLVQCGEQTYQHFTKMISQYLIDTEGERDPL